MKHLIIIISSILLINSYLLSTEYPRHKELSRKQMFKNNQKSSIMFHNQLNHYDITVENSTIIEPRKSERIFLSSEESRAIKVFVDAIDSELTLKFEYIPQNISFVEKQNCVEVIYDEECVKKYAYKGKNKKYREHK